MKKMSEIISEKITTKKYHLSYDTIKCENDFNSNAEEARKYVLNVLIKTKPKNIFSFTESTFIIDYGEAQPKLLNYIAINLKKYFHYTLSMVTDDNSQYKSTLSYNEKPDLNENLQNLLKTDIEKDVKKTISEY